MVDWLLQLNTRSKMLVKRAQLDRLPWPTVLHLFTVLSICCFSCDNSIKREKVACSDFFLLISKACLKKRLLRRRVFELIAALHFTEVCDLSANYPWNCLTCREEAARAIVMEVSKLI